MSKYPLQRSSDANESNPYLNRAHMRRFGKQPFAWNGKNAGDGFKWGGTYYSWNDDNWDEEESKGKYIPKEMSEQEGETQKDMELSLNQEDGYELFGQTFDRNEVIIMKSMLGREKNITG